jgi:hypothetical protein
LTGIAFVPEQQELRDFPVMVIVFSKGLAKEKDSIDVYQLLREPSISRISRQIAQRVQTFLQSNSVISNIEIEKS